MQSVVASTGTPRRDNDRLLKPSRELPGVPTSESPDRQVNATNQKAQRPTAAAIQKRMPYLQRSIAVALSATAK
jgi:hypothetical protein